MRKRPAESRVIRPEDQLPVGSTYIVKRFNGKVDEKVIAVLIATKDVCNNELQKNRDEKMEKNLHNPGSTQEKLADGSEVGKSSPVKPASPVKKHRLYYIHYHGLDRRMDEWVERERFVEFAPAGAEIMAAPLASSGIGEGIMPSGTVTRSQRRIHEEFHHVQKSYDDMDAFTAKLEREHEERTKIKNIQQLSFGNYDISTWYFSPFPKDCAKLDRLYMCEFCLAYCSTKEKFDCHKFHKCKTRQPPGDEIYRKKNISLFEVDGRSQKLYSQCLCLLSKLFMDHKTLYFDVGSFHFYVLCEVDKHGAHIVGHFSKERFSENNLACIMILPPYQRKGYGKLLIQLSYEMSMREGWIGTPEKPLSDLGKVSYRSYWWWRLLAAMDKLVNHEKMGHAVDISAGELATYACVNEDDVVSTLQTMQMVKYWKGERIIRLNRKVIEHCKHLNMGRAPKLLMDPKALRYTPIETRGPPLKYPA